MPPEGFHPNLFSGFSALELFSAISSWALVAVGLFASVFVVAIAYVVVTDWLVPEAATLFGAPSSMPFYSGAYNLSPGAQAIVQAQRDRESAEFYLSDRDYDTGLAGRIHDDISGMSDSSQEGDDRDDD